MRQGAGMALVLGSVVAVTAPTWAIDREQIQEVKRTARAELLQRQATPAASSKGEKSLVVRCDHGDSLQATLDRNPGPLTVEIVGICAESVRLARRDDLTLRGTDPATDGIRGATDPPRDAALEIHRGDRIAIENLSVSHGPGIGLGLWFSQATIDNCWFNDNGNIGLHVSASSYVRATRVQASRNAGSGINVQRQSVVVCQACDLVDNQGWAHTALSGGTSTLWDGIVSGSRGLYAQGEGSYVDLDCYSGPSTTHGCSLTVGEGRAAQAAEGGTVGFWAAPFEGLLRAVDGGIDLAGSRQAPLAEAANELVGTSLISASGWEDKAGSPLDTELAQTNLHGYSRATFDTGTVFLSWVQCWDAGDAIADGVEVAEKVFFCPHVPGYWWP